MAKPIIISGFQGINANHNRKLEQLGGGKNFRTNQGAFFTRPGSVSITPPSPCTSIKSLFRAPLVSADTRLLLEEGNNLWHKTTGAWATVKTNLNGTRLDGCRWQNYYLLGNGNQMLAYDVVNRTIADLGGTPPAMQHFVEWRFRPFGWAPDFANPHLLNYAGYDVDNNISKDVWPTNYALNIGGDSGLPIQNCFPLKTHLVGFTRKFFRQVMGTDETNFEILDPIYIGLYAPRLGRIVGDYLIFVGEDRRVYLYTGSLPVPISGNIDELLDDEDYADAFALSFDNMFWLLFPGSTTTTVYIFDPAENDWYIDIYPAVISAGYSYGAYNSPESIYFATGAGTMFKLDDTVDTDFGSATLTTEAEIGPIDMAGAEFILNNLHVGTDPKNNFTVNVYATCDRLAAKGPFSASFTTGTQDTKEIMLQQVRGKNVMLKISSTDRINELQRITLMASAWGVK